MTLYKKHVLGNKVRLKGIRVFSQSTETLFCDMKYIFVVIVVLIVSCKDYQKQNAGVDEFYTIHLEQSLKREQALLVSDIADSVEYIILETPRDIIISGIRQVVPFKEYLFVLARGYVYQFLRNGQFVRQIGLQGSGPGEYVSATKVVINSPNNEIVIGGISQLLFYTMDGIFLRSEIFPTGEFAISDSLIWVAYSPTVWNEYQAIAFTLNRDTVSYIRNEAFGKARVSGGYLTIMSFLLTSFYFYNGSAFFKGFEDNDTIWKLSGSNAKPHAHINMGRYKLPLEYMPGTQAYIQHGENFLGIPLFFETDDYFFFMTQNRRLYENNFLAFNKKNGIGFIIKDEKGLGITDNILGGPHIKPLWSTEKYIISVYEGVDLLEDIELGNFSPILAFQKQLSTVTENTNQLIILCHKKR